MNILTTVIIEISVNCNLRSLMHPHHLRQERFPLSLPQRQSVNMKLATWCEIFSCLYEGWSSSCVLLTRESTKLVVCEAGTESQKTNNGSWLQNHRHVHLTFTSIQSLSKVHATSYISISGQARYLYPQVLGLKFKYQADLPLQMILRWVIVDGNQYFYQLV